MFGKKKSEIELLYPVDIGEKQYWVEQTVYDYLKDLRHSLSNAKEELELIKPVLETGKLEPAVSEMCYNCKFAIVSKWDGKVLGCCRGVVCDDYIPKEE